MSGQTKFLTAQYRGWLILGLAVLAIIFPLLAPTFWVMLITQALIFAIAAMSLDLLIGYTDLGSLGHAAFLAIGAYTTAILAVKFGFGLASTLILSIALAAAAGAIFGLLALRAAGIYFLLITLAIAMIIWGLLYSWVSLTGGDNGLPGVTRPDIGIPLADSIYFYYFILAFFVVCLILMLLIVRSPFGKTLVGIRDSESRMRVLGFNTWLHKYLIFIITAAFAGLAGGLFAYYNEFVSTDLSNLTMCMGLVLMVIIGGPGTLVGAIIGAFVIVYLENIVSIYTERWLMILAAVYIATAIWAPKGVMGLIRRRNN